MPASPPPGSTPPARSGDLAHELTSSLSALLLGLQRLRAMQGGPDKQRALALLDRMETAVRGISALLESLRAPAAPGDDS
jgi:signal transduction histidine kinase